MIKNIIFDFGGVYLDLKGKHTGIPAMLAQALNIPEKAASRIWQENKESVLIGKQAPRQFLQNIKEKLELEIDENVAYEIWRKANHIAKEQINWELVNYTTELKKKYKLYMLTDTIDLDNGAGEWIDKITDQFDKIFKSYEIQLRKPHPDVFFYVLKEINALPKDCLFIDDYIENTDSANNIGIKAIQYKNIKQLKEEIMRIEK
jgi:putative hydrolase of the HAD superfamily